MALITKFLKLLKPQPNEYINVTTQISDNYDKIDAEMEKLSKSNDGKYDKTGGTISGNVVVTGNEVVNGSVSCNSFILNGYTVTIEE